MSIVSMNWWSKHWERIEWYTTFCASSIQCFACLKKSCLLLQSTSKTIWCNNKSCLPLQSYSKYCYLCIFTCTSIWPLCTRQPFIRKHVLAQIYNIGLQWLETKLLLLDEWNKFKIRICQIILCDYYLTVLYYSITYMLDINVKNRKHS